MPRKRNSRALGLAERFQLKDSVIDVQGMRLITNFPDKRSARKLSGSRSPVKRLRRRLLRSHLLERRFKIPFLLRAQAAAQRRSSGCHKPASGG
jgi:hypothetical protein